MISPLEFQDLKRGEKLILSKETENAKIGDIFYFHSIHNVVDWKEKAIDLIYNDRLIHISEKFFIGYFDTCRGWRERKIESILK